MSEASIIHMTQEKRRVALTSVFAAVFLTSIKLVVGVITNSLGIIAEALHSGLDLVASLVTYIAVRISDRPADDRHPYGYGKIESLSALIESGLLFITCGWVIYEALRRMISHEMRIRVGAIGIVVMVISIVVDFGRSRALRHVARKYSSQALEADALHFSTDIFSSMAVIGGLILVYFGVAIGDPLVALGVASFVVLSAVRLTIRAVEILMDRARRSDIERVKESIDAASEVESYSNLRIRRAGNKTFIDLIVRVSPTLPLARAHEVTEKLEHEIAKRIPPSDVVIHVEPSGFGGTIIVSEENGVLNREEVTRQIDQILSDHMAQFVDFHDVMAETLDNVPTINFHLVMPRDAHVKETHEFCDHIEHDIKEHLSSARVNIHVEPCNMSCEACQVACKLKT